MSSSSVIPRLFPNGSITQLFCFPTAAALLLDYDRGETVRLLGLGFFFVDLAVQTVSPILISFCSVNGFQWPLTKDTPIIRICRRTFIFGIPGLLYALQFPSICSDTAIKSLERVFMKYGHYKDFGVSAGGPGYPCPDNQPSLWTTVRPLVQPKAHEILTQFNLEPGRSRFSLLHHNSCFERATRMSATTKVIAQALLSGLLRPAHISIKGIDRFSNPASPSITVFTVLVDAVEASWVISCGLSYRMVNAYAPLLRYYPGPGFRVWRLNEMGLVTFVRDLHAAGEYEHELVLAGTAIGEEDKEKGEASHASTGNNKGSGKKDKP